MKIILFCIAFWGFIGTASAQLYLQNGAAIHQQAAAHICLQDISLVQNGSWNATTGSVLRLKESIGNADISIGGNNTAAFQNVIVQMQNREVKLLRDIQVNGMITFASGHFNLNGYDIELGANAAISGENENASFTGANGGSLIMQLNLNAPDEANPGNLGAEITSAENLGLTTIERKHQIVNNNGNQSIARQYVISPTNNTGLNATLRFHYLDSELNGIPENELELWRNDGTDWENMGFSNRSSANNYVELTGINAFSAWTATNPANPLPVELTRFSGHFSEGRVILQWTTATENNNSHFEVEKSQHGLEFSSLSVVPGGSNSQTERSYQTEDDHPFYPVTYYRLRQTDFDGRQTHSPVIGIRTGTSRDILKAYPNPFQENLRIETTSNLELHIIDAGGRILWRHPAALNALEVNLAHIPAGVYQLLLSDRHGNTVQKTIVKCD